MCHCRNSLRILPGISVERGLTPRREGLTQISHLDLKYVKTSSNCCRHEWVTCLINFEHSEDEDTEPSSKPLKNSE